MKCKKCGSERVALGTTAIYSMIPDQEPFESGVFEDCDEIEGIEVGIGVHVCVACGELYDAWIEDPIEKPPWIPVSERLPTRKKECCKWQLVTLTFDPGGMPRRIDRAFYDEVDQLWMGVHGRIDPRWSVTHWMPQPDLPTE